ncbi:solute carrier family 46 member 3-like [Mercenaria mercenaria]|uniref:solute carrier family 46 member 3-like n=1 Tax=Mercenaria mercenaria TaxID=6596 RepID=UPI00234E47CD|nr:solute carrier family 46 member 3-like [Mercenaria mercenaria]
MKGNKLDLGENSPLIEPNEDIPVPYESEKKPIEGDAGNNLMLPPNQVITRCHFLVWPVAFLFVTAYYFTFTAFGQYVYIKLQNENFPGIRVNKTTAYCEVNTSSINFKIQEDVQQKAATWGIYFYLSGGLTSIVANFIMGAYTDRFGRKFLFILPCIGTIVRTSLAMVGIYYDLPLPYYIAGYFIEGCTGQIFNIFQITYIYAADITENGKSRSVGIIIVELAIGIGIVAPTLAVGFILEETNSFLVPFYISLGILVLTLFLMFLLPETYPKAIRSQRRYTSKFENLKDAVDLYFSKKNSGRRWMYIVSILVFSFTVYNALGRTAMEGLFLLNYPLCWNPTKIGVFGSMRVAFQQIVGMACVKLFHLCMNDEMIIIIGCISYAASFVLEAYATNDLMMYLVAIVGTFGLLTIPMIRSILSQMTSPQKQGAVFASISAVETAVNCIGALSANSVYIATVKIQRGFTFILFAGFSVISMILMIIFMIGTRGSKNRIYNGKDP